MNSFLLHHLYVYKPFAYLAVFLGVLLEGEAVIFASFFLAHQRYFKLAELIPIIAAGVLAGDHIWYWIGLRLSGRNHPAALWIEKAAKLLDRIIIKNPTKGLLFGKFLYGLGRATLIRIGMLGVSWRRFLQAEFVAGTVWLSALAALAYVFGTFVKAINYFKYAELSLLAGLLLFFVFEKFARKAAEKDKNNIEKNPPV